MPDAPLAPLGTPMHLVDPATGRPVTRPAFFPPSDVRHETHLAGIINGRERLFYYGPDATRDGIHVAATVVSAYGAPRIVYFGPHEFVLADPDEDAAA